MLNIKILGTAPGVPVADRYHSAFLLESSVSTYLVDCGEPCSHSLKKAGVDFIDIDAVFISHGHSDHIAGLPMLIQGCWLAGRKSSLPLYLPEELISPLQAWLNACYLPDKLIGFPLQFHAWENHAKLNLGEIELAISPTSHLDGLKAFIEPTANNRFKAYSMAFSYEGKRMVYSADIGMPADLDPILNDHCDLMICELSHFSPEELCDYLKNKSIKKLILTHVSQRKWENIDSVLSDLRNSLPTIEEIDIAEAGMELSL